MLILKKWISFTKIEFKALYLPKEIVYGIEEVVLLEDMDDVVEIVLVELVDEASALNVLLMVDLIEDEDMIDKVDGNRLDVPANVVYTVETAPDFVEFIVMKIFI